MSERIVAEGRSVILYDDSVARQAGAEWFSPRHWGRRTGLRRLMGGGRGNIWIVTAPGGDWVLRHYRRGGWAAKITTDFYWWRGIERSRPWREWRLLHTLYKEGLPVPQPVAARVIRHGWLYRGDLITRLIPACRSLAAILRESAIEDLPWEAIGRCIRRFHDAGVCHADLNAHNVMIDEHDQVFLVDFDKGERGTRSRHWRDGNLKRLRRSLHKLAAAAVIERGAWKALLQGYTQDAQG